MRDYKVMIRLSKKEKEILDRLAADEGLPTASWARQLLLRTAKQGPNGLTNSVQSVENMPLLSLFCGPGGLDEGFRQAGFFTELAFDIHEDSVITFRKNHPGSNAYAHDICKLCISKLDELAGRTFTPVGVLGGPPCQSFSFSNVHQSESDPRHKLPEVYATLLKQLNARSPISFFIFENVPGLLGNKHRHRYEKFKGMFQEAGFRIHEEQLDAQDYGVPQIRPRVFIIGINENVHPDAQWVTPPPSNKIVTVRDVIEGLPDPVVNRRGLDPSTFPVHPNHWCLVPKSRKFENADLTEGQMFGRSFRTLYWDKPSWTVAYGHREVHVHPSGKRRLSMYEALLLQSFPKHYVLHGNLSSQIKQISEAVPPKLALHLAKAIKLSIGFDNDGRVL